MICEFALEPELVATWHDRNEFLFFDEKFGIRTRRIISAYPHKWRRMVMAAFRQGPCADNQNAELRMSALLDDLCQNIVNRKSTFQEINVWLERTEREHNDRPFHAIVAKDNPRTNSHVIVKSELIQNGHRFWRTPEIPVIQRNAEALAEAVGPLLRGCQHAIFVDPYFDPNKPQFINPFKRFFIETWDRSHCNENVIVELHTSIDRFFHGWHRGDQRNPDGEENVVINLISDLREKLPRIIPSGKTLSVYLWKECENGEKLHNRYILSEIAGVMFGTGLDQAKAMESLETDDLSILSNVQLDQRWKQFKSTPSAFTSVHEVIEIIGRRR